MRYKEVHSIRVAKEKIKELKIRIKYAKQAIEEIKIFEGLKFRSLLISKRNRRIGQLNRQIKHYEAEIELMKKINKSLTENIY